MFNKMNTGKIAMYSIALILLACIIMWWTSNNGTKSAPGDGMLIVTPMPAIDYSVEDMNNGLPEALPETLMPVTMESEPDVITQSPMIDDSMPQESDIEEFSNFASRQWRGNIL